MSALRSAVRIAAKQALGQHATAAAAGCAPRTGAAIATALRSTRVVPAVQGRALQARQCSSSRFLSLADDGDDKKSGSAIASGTDGSDDSSTADGADGEAREDEDGDLKLDEEADINDGGVDIDEDLDADVMQLFMENPAKWTSEKLARKFHLTKPRVEAIIYLKGEEAGFTPAEFAAKIADAKAASQARMDDDAAALARAQASGDEKEVRRLEKRARQSFEQEENEELSAHDEALLLGKDDDAFRNPDFFFLNDEFDGLPPLVRRLGKHGSTDKLYPEEALALQSMASNNVVTTLKSFAKATPDAKSKWTIALKDISKKKKPLYVRDQHQTLRLATDAETLPRTWVRRPSFFSGLKH